MLSYCIHIVILQSSSIFQFTIREYQELSSFLIDKISHIVVQFVNVRVMSEVVQFTQ